MDYARRGSRNRILMVLLVATLLVAEFGFADAKKKGGAGSSSGSSSSCFLESISYNPRACETRWVVTFCAFIGLLGLMVVYLLILANLSRTPWNKTLYVSLDRLFDNVQEGPTEPGEEGEAPPPTSPRLNICERCGTSSHIRELVSGRGGTIVLCAGCIGYKLMLKFLPAMCFLIPATFMCWYFDIGGGVFLEEVFLGIGYLVLICVVLLQLGWNRPVLHFVFACRPAPDGDSEGATFQRLQRALDAQSTQLLNTLNSRAHREAIHSLLQEEEEILWIQRVPFALFVRHNYDLQLLIWCFIAVPALWGCIGLLSLFYERSSADVAFGLWLTFFVIIFSVPYLIAAYLRCQVTYVLTNMRAMRVTSTMLFSTRVYSFPYHRMDTFYFLNFPNTPVDSPTSGKVGWSLWPDEDSFSHFEFVSNTLEVEQVVNRVRGVETDAIISTEGTDFDVNIQKQQAKHFFLLQFIPLLVLPLLALGASIFDWVDWAFLVIVVLPVLWCTFFFHLLFRKFYFLSNCALRVHPLRPQPMA